MIDLRRLAEFVDPADWSRETEDDGYEHLSYCGDAADNDPTWDITHYGSSYAVEFQIGWYEQIGEADSDDELVTLVRAMAAAYEALSCVLNGGRTHA